MSDLKILANQLNALTAQRLSTRARLLHLGLVLVALALSALLVGLLLDEPALPVQTRVAFLVLLGIGLSWAVYGLWVLCGQDRHFVHQQLIAARLATAFCALFTLGALGMAIWGDRPTLGWAALCGSLQWMVAIWLLVRASRRRRLLEERLAMLQASIPSVPR